MNETLYNVLVQTGAYLIVFVVTIIIINFLTKNYLLIYLRVKASRGKKILVRIMSYTGFYYRSGGLDNGVLQFKNRLKNMDSYKISKEDIFQEMGVNVICVDETTKKVLKLNGDSEEGHDTEKFQSLLQRALYKPNLKDDVKNIIMLVFSVLNFIGILIVVYILLTSANVGSTIGVV